ncbi:MAG: YiiX/YebB-like N1pC/P60 family cysteine hydrolase [Planctomycetota bacterium]|nr:YiiX/YebB-like N1pC/P60 family cysteine hydrolase [Planctomycetota bacterium]
MPFRSRPHTRETMRLLWLPCLLLLVGCHGMGRGHGNQAELWPRAVSHAAGSRREVPWNSWAAGHLQSGDIVFVLGESRILLGLVNFSKLSTEIADSRFSHVGLVAREGDQVVVYDIVAEGARRMPFGAFVNDGRVWSVAVKRLRPEYQYCVPAAIAYCQKVVASKTRFDSDFRLDNDRLYCSEMLELAFESGGLSLADPVPMNELPRFDKLREPTKRLIQVATRIDFNQPMYMPGNDQFGIWSCPHLELVLVSVDPALPPPQDASLTESDFAGSYELAVPADTASADQTLRGPIGTRQAAMPQASRADR